MRQRLSEFNQGLPAGTTGVSLCGGSRTAHRILVVGQGDPHVGTRTCYVGPQQLHSPLGLSAPEDALIRSVLTLHDDPEKTTANLMAPIVLNRRTRKGRQVVLQGTNLSMRYPVFESLRMAAEA
jgi:hypothetical protein